MTLEHGATVFSLFTGSVAVLGTASSLWFQWRRPRGADTRRLHADLAAARRDERRELRAAARHTAAAHAASAQRAYLLAALTDAGLPTVTGSVPIPRRAAANTPARDGALPS